MNTKEKVNIHQMMVERKKERLQGFHDQQINATCISGVSIRANDPVRVVLLIENLIMTNTLPMEDRRNHFKVFGLPMQGIYKGNGEIELKVTAEHCFNTSLFDKISKKQIDLTEFVNSLKDQERGFVPYQKKCHFSLALIDEKVFKSTQNFEGFMRFFGKTLEKREEFFNDVFYRLSNVQVNYTPPEEDINDKEKNDFIIKMRKEGVQRMLIEKELKVLDSFFYDYQNTILKAMGKNQYNLLYAFHALDVLNCNSFALTPMRLINNDKLSALKNIQKANLEVLDLEMKELIDYKVEQIPCITFTNIRDLDKNIVYSSNGKKNIDLDVLKFEGKSKVFKRKELFPLNEYINDDSEYIKIINDEHKEDEE